MKAKKVIYSRLVSLGNYENAKFEIELELEEGEKAADAFNLAKEFIENRVKVAKIPLYKKDEALRMVNDPDNYIGNDVKEARELIKTINLETEDLPF